MGQIAKRPYMYLPLKGDTNDYSVNAQNPSNTGVATTTGQFGESNGAYEWADASDRLSWASGIGNNIATKINNNITFFYFMQASSVPSASYRFTAHQWASTGSLSFAIINRNISPNTNSYWYIHDSSGYVSKYSNNNALTTNWDCFAFTTFNNSTNLDYKFYKNASSEGSGTIGYNTQLSSGFEFRIGSQSTVNTLGNFGKMHTFRIYDVTLTDAQLKILNNEKGRIRA